VPDRCWRRYTTNMDGTLLVTRPAPDGEPLQQALQQLGWRCLWQPLIEIEAGSDLFRLPALLNSLREDDLLIAVSKHALWQADAALQQLNLRWPSQPTYLAVGKKTASVWQQMGVSQVWTPEREDSEGLLALQPLRKPATRRVVILRGQQGREHLAEQLRKRGAEVEYLACYQRRQLQLDGEQLLNDWQQAGVKYLLITSGEMLQQMLMLANNQQHWLRERSLVVVSQRIADMARSAGFTKIIVSKDVTAQAIDAALHQFIKV